MNRRSFLQFLGVGVAAVAVAPSVLAAVASSLPAAASETTCQEPITACIGEYYEYANFSDYSIASAIDASVGEEAEQLAHQAGLSLDNLMVSNVGGQDISSSVVDLNKYVPSQGWTSYKFHQALPPVPGTNRMFFRYDLNNQMVENNKKELARIRKETGLEQ